jgi:hypothetical protein
MLRFRLRTLLIAIALLAVPMAWVGWQLNWIRQRRALLESRAVASHGWGLELPTAPSCLWLFGEDGLGVLALRDTTSNETVMDAKAIFPEADVRRSGEVWDDKQHGTGFY